MKVTKKEMKMIREQLWEALDCAQCTGEENLLNLDPRHFDLEKDEVKTLQSLIKRIDLFFCVFL